MTHLPRFSLSLLMAGALVVAPSAAFAHDELLGSDPQDSSSAEAPEEVTLTYSGQISDVGATVQVTGEDGTDVTEGSPQVVGTDVVQDLAEDLPDGEYAVAWRVTSEDGHPIAGEFGFTVVGSEDDPADESASAEPTSQEATAEETEDGTETQTSAEPTTQAAEPTPEETGAEATTEAESTEDAAAASTPAESGGLPVWAWAFIVIAVLGLGAALTMTWGRARRRS